MTEEEQLLQALEEVEKLRKDMEELQTMNLESAFQTGGPRAYRGSRDKVHHGPVVVKVKDSLLRDTDGETVVTGPVAGVVGDPKNPSGLDHSLPRTSTPMRSKHQRTAIAKVWKYRNFKQCGTCGCYDTYKSRCLPETNGVEFWCYQCGAQGEDVTQEFQPLPDAKHKQRECSICGKQIWITRGDKMFRTGEIDPVTRKPDYCCEACNLLANRTKKGDGE